MSWALKNFARVRVTSLYGVSETSIMVDDGSILADPSVDSVFEASWWNSQDFPDPTDDPFREIVRVLSISGNTLTIKRGVGGTTAQLHNLSGKVYSLALIQSAGSMRSANWFNLLSYGADRTGVVVCTTMFQESIDDASAAGGGIVFLNTGTFVVDDPNSDSRCLVPKPGVTIRGSGIGSTVIKLKDNTAPGSLSPRIFSIDAACPNFTLEDITLDGNKANNTGGNNDQKHGIMIFGFAADDLHLRRVELKNCDGDGVYVHDTSQRVLIEECIARDNDRIGLNISGASNSRIINNFTRTNGSWGIKGEQESSTVSQVGITIEGNVVRNEVSGIGLTALNPKLYSDCKIINNTIETCSAKGIQCQGGIRGLIIGHNTVKAATGNGILIGMDVTGFDIDTNTVIGTIDASGSRDAAIGVGGQSSALSFGNGIIKGNVVEGGTTRGIIVGSTGGGTPIDVVDMIIRGNSIKNNGKTGIECGDCIGLNVTDNEIGNNTTTGLFLREFATGSGCKQVQVSRNRFTAGNQSLHVVFENQASVVDGLRMRDNFFPTSGGTILSNYNATNVLNDKISGNNRFITEARGLATITSGNTSVVVTHGLSFTPTLSQIQVSVASAWGTATKFWISTPTSTQFTINVDIDPLASVDFSWSASKD